MARDCRIISVSDMVVIVKQPDLLSTHFAMLPPIFHNAELSNLLLRDFNIAELAILAHTSRETREVVTNQVTRSVRIQVRPFFLEEGNGFVIAYRPD